MTTKTCQQCGKEYKSSPSKNMKYCGRDCYYESKKIIIIDRMKQCTKCNELKNIDEFPPDKRTVSGKGSYCRKCGRNSYIINKYNIDEIEYENYFKLQNGVCAICGKPETSFDRKQGIIRRLAIDHDHVTGKVRGLLCSNCNQGIGRMSDDISILKSAIKYLENFTEGTNDKQG
ncbi:MAG: endonuclease VII domain-containing protein [Candidatus Paceibacterota bacterium]